MTEPTKPHGEGCCEVDAPVTGPRIVSPQEAQELIVSNKCNEPGADVNELALVRHSESSGVTSWCGCAQFPRPHIHG
jgi:hypothetical protein